MLDINAYRSSEPLPAAVRAGTRRRLRRPAYLGGNPPMWWLARAAAAGKPALVLGIALWFRKGLQKGKQGLIRVDAALRKWMGLSPDQASRGVEALRAAGLVDIHVGGRGRCPQVVIVVDPPEPSVAPRRGQASSK